MKGFIFSNISTYSRYLGYSAVFLAAALFSVPALAQDHGVGVGKSCPTPSKIGDLARCTMSVANEDEYGDSLVISEFWDIVGTAPNDFRNPPAGNLPIIAIDAGVVCTPGDGPIGVVFPCTLPGTPTPPGGNGSGLGLTVESEYIVPEAATNPLLDQANVIVTDQCDNPGTIGCNPTPQQQQFGAAVSLFEPSLEVTKTGPDTAKVGDEITYTIGFNDTSTGTGFPGFENCTGFDPLLGGDLGAFEDGVPRDFNYIVEPGPDPLLNTATITCDVIGYENQASGEASHSVDLIDPAIEVTKTGPPIAKVGDEITYTIGFDSLSDGDSLGVCTGFDPLLGGDLGAFEDGATRDFNYIVQPDDSNPLVNVVTITCEVEGLDNEVSGEASHSVDLINPGIDVTKTGPDTAKAGDEITYTIGFDSTGTGSLGVCTGFDPLLGGDLGAFEDGATRDFNYIVQPNDPDPLVNVVTITCEVEGLANEVSGDARHSVDLIDPSVELSKECRPDPVQVGASINWAIIVDNTGDVELDCVVNDPIAGFVDEPVSVAPGGTEVLNASRPVEEADFPVISNTATVDCQVPEFDNELSDEAMADCEVQVADEICRTPGFWGTHAGTEKKKGQNITQGVIDAAIAENGLGLDVCGTYIDNTMLLSNTSALEAMCVSVEGEQEHQLVRQLTAAALNCTIGECSTEHANLLANCNTVCDTGVGDIGMCIEALDCFNNGDDWDGSMCIRDAGFCAISGAACDADNPCPMVDDVEDVCVPNETCHDRDLCPDDEDDGEINGSALCFLPPHPASSSKACNDAIGNDTYVP